MCVYVWSFKELIVVLTLLALASMEDSPWGSDS